MKRLHTLPSILVLILLSSCATLSPDYEEPSVGLTTFRAIPSEGALPTFEIGLRIINPNAHDLDLRGIVYTISLDGREVMKGVGKDYPVIEAYSQQDVTLVAGVQLLESIQLFADLARSGREALRYDFEAKLDLGGLYPSIRVSESGALDFGGR